MGEIGTVNQILSESFMKIIVFFIETLIEWLWEVVGVGAGDGEELSLQQFLSILGPQKCGIVSLATLRTASI